MKRRINSIEKKGRRNPYFRTNKSKPKLLIIVVVLLATTICSGFVYFLFSPKYQLENIVVNGAANDIKGSIESRAISHLNERILFVLPKKHPLLFSKIELEKVLLDEFPLNSATVTHSNRTISVDVIEKIRTYFVLSDDNLFSVDRSGYVISEISDLERIQISLNKSSDIPTIELNGNEKVTLGKTVLSEDMFEQIVFVIDEIHANTLLSAKKVEVIEDEQRLNVETDNGVVLYIALNRDMSDQISKLEALISRKLVELEELTYIDLRYQNRLYYH